MMNVWHRTAQLCWPTQQTAMNAADVYCLQGTDHVARVARFAVDAVAAAAKVLIDVSDPSKGTVTLRAGFDCGPAMACVVGTRAKKFVLLGERSIFCLVLSFSLNLIWLQGTLLTLPAAWSQCHCQGVCSAHIVQLGFWLSRTQRFLCYAEEISTSRVRYVTQTTGYEVQSNPEI